MGRVRTSPWPPPNGAPFGTSGWYLASDGEWYQTDESPAPGYVVGPDGRWTIDVDPEQRWRSSRWGLGDVLWGALVYLGLSIGAGVVLVVVDSIRNGEGSVDNLDVGVYAISMFVALNAIAFVGVPWLATRRKGLRSLRWDFGLRIRPRDIGIGIGMGIAGLVAAGLVGTAIDHAFDADETTSNIPVDSLHGIGEVLAFGLSVAVLTPVIEELFFRGLLYRSNLKRGSSVTASIALTTVVFVIPHLLAAEDLPSLVSLAGSIAMLGLAFNLACHFAHNRLGASIIAHMVVNGLAVVALALS
jgi:hypothetical protein